MSIKLHVRTPIRNEVRAIVAAASVRFSTLPSFYFRVLPFGIAMCCMYTKKKELKKKRIKRTTTTFYRHNNIIA